MQKQFEEYALISAQIKELTDKKSAVAAEILADMRERGVSKEEHGVGAFTISKLKKWTYPAYVSEAEESFKSLKAKSESTGDATYEEQDSLRFTSVKL